MDIIELIRETGIEPKRKASSHGGEYCSPCPFCKDGDDRFLSWPQRTNKNGDYQGGRFSCRVCGKYGDAITFLRELRGLSYKEACSCLRIEPKERNNTHVFREKPQPPTAIEPPALWKEKAKAFVEWSHAQLINNPEAKAEIISRGFTEESIYRFKFGFTPKDFFREREEWGLEPQIKDDGTPRKLWLPTGLVVPSLSADGSVTKVKVRRSAWKAGDKLPKYVEISGSKKSPSIYGDTSLPCAFVLESEIDGLLIQQFASDAVYCVALGGSTKSLDLQTDMLLRSTPLVLFCPDFDQAGAVAWVKWQKLFPNIQRILTPDGKAPGDAFLAGVDLREWITESIKEIKRKFS